jgi:hypothetical protein
VLVLTALVLGARANAVRNKHLLDEKTDRFEDLQVVEGLVLLFHPSFHGFFKFRVLDQILSDQFPVFCLRRLHAEQDVVDDFDGRKRTLRGARSELLVGCEPRAFATVEQKRYVALIHGV